jgi:hypothetical protein
MNNPSAIVVQQLDPKWWKSPQILSWQGPKSISSMFPRARVHNPFRDSIPPRILHTSYFQLLFGHLSPVPTPHRGIYRERKPETRIYNLVFSRGRKKKCCKMSRKKSSQCETGFRWPSGVVNSICHDSCYPSITAWSSRPKVFSTESEGFLHMLLLNVGEYSIDECLFARVS